MADSRMKSKANGLISKTGSFFSRFFIAHFCFICYTFSYLYLCIFISLYIFLNKKHLGKRWACLLSGWHVCGVCIFSPCFEGFLPQSKDMRCRLIGVSKFGVGVCDCAL